MQLTETMGNERRSRERFRIEQEVLYRAVDRQHIAQTGSGRIVNISSSGVCFTTRNAFDIGMSMELSVSWPVLLGDSCPIKLMLRGRVIRCGEESAALAIERYEFRTQGSRGLSSSDGVAKPAPDRGGRSSSAPPRIAVERRTHPAGEEGRCECGVCRRCLDDARWERVFNEKFADPDYYRAMRTRNRSSLSLT